MLPVKKHKTETNVGMICYLLISLWYSKRDRSMSLCYRIPDTSLCDISD